MIELAPDDGGQKAQAPDCAEPGTYCDRTAAVGIGGILALGRGAAVADVDSDGWLDVFLVDTNTSTYDPVDWGQTHLYLNLGEDRGFVAYDVGIADAHIDGAWAGSFADYDNDGDPDLMIASGGYSSNSTLSLYENRLAEEARFVDASDRLGLDPTLLENRPFWGVTWADIENDGFLDAVVTILEGRALLFRNLGDGTFEEVGAARGLVDTLDTDLKNPVFFDFDLDRDPDLYLSGIDGDGFYRNDDGNFVRLPGPFDDEPYGPFTFATLVSDFDNDGYDDLYFGRWTCQDYIFFGGPDGGFTELGAEIGLDARLICPWWGVVSDPFENTMGLSVIDLFDDGAPDIFIGTGNPHHAAPDILYCNRGGRRFERCTEVLFRPGDPQLYTRGHGVVQADFDNDGDGDLVFNPGGHPHPSVTEDSREHRRYFAYEPSDTVSTVSVTLRGTVSNRDAVGARVVARGGRTTRHVVRSTQGFQSQNAARLLIPTHGAMDVELEISWPSGRTSTATIRAGDAVELVEPR